MRQEFRDVPLDALLEERDSIKIRINLRQNGDGATSSSIAAMEKELAEIEKNIAEHRKAAGA
jgi:hypothetical protein